MKPNRTGVYINVIKSKVKQAYQIAKKSHQEALILRDFKATEQALGEMKAYENVLKMLNFKGDKDE